MKNPTEKRILFVSPYQAIPEHSFVERKIADLLSEEDGAYQFDVLTCDGFMNTFCTAMASNKLTYAAAEREKEKICRKCRSYRAENFRSFQGRVFSVESKLTTEMAETVSREEHKIRELMHEYNYENVPLGRISSYELILNHKLKTIHHLLPAIATEYIHTIANNLKVLLVCNELFRKERYDFVLFYNGNYGFNNTISTLIKKSFPFMRHISIHYGLNWAIPMSSLFLVNGYHQEHLRDRIRFFEKHREEIDLSSYDRSEIEAYIHALHSGKSEWVYSVAKSNQVEQIFHKLNLDKEKPTAMLAVASLDEIWGLEFAVFDSALSWVENTFQDQFEWMEKTISFFAEHPEWQLILRIHPREFPNKRDKVLSKSASFYEDLAKRLPPNVVINAPDQQISIYDLFDIVHLNLTSWSSVGLESSLIGLPTISSTRGISLYPNQYVHFFSSEPSEYFEQIGRVLSKNRQIDAQQTERAKEWLLYDFNHTTVRFKTNGFWHKKPPFFRRLVNKFFFPMNVRTYRNFSRLFEINSFEKLVLKKFFSTKEEVFEIKSRLQKSETSRQ